MMKLNWKALAIGLALGCAPEADASDGWQINETLSPIDDSKNVSIAVTSTEPFVDKFGRERWGGLMIDCTDHQTIFGIWAGDLVLGAGASMSSQVIYRLDKNPAVTHDFSVASNFKFVGLWDGRGIPLIKKIAQSKQFFIRIEPYLGGSIDLKFDVTNLKVHLPKVRDACNW